MDRYRDPDPFLHTYPYNHLQFHSIEYGGQYGHEYINRFYHKNLHLLGDLYPHVHLDLVFDDHLHYDLNGHPDLHADGYSDY